MSSNLLTKQYFNVFSRIARTYDQKHNVIKQDRLEILLEQPKIKRYSPKEPSRKKPELDGERLEEVLRSSKPQKFQKTTFPANSPTFRTQSREDYYLSNAIRAGHPLPALYNCNYNLTSKRSPTANFKYRPPTQSKQRKIQVKTEPQSVAKPPTKLKLPLEFSKQLPREFRYNEVNERRFLAFNDKPEVSSNVKRVSTPNFSRGKGHEFSIKLCDNSSNYQLTANTTSKTVNFGKSQPRQPLLFGTMYDLVYDNVSYALIEKASPAFSMKQPSRSDSALPSHMQISGSRAALSTLSSSTLKQNCYSSMGQSALSTLTEELHSNNSVRRFQSYVDDC